MKTIKQIKDEHAKEIGYPDFEELFSECAHTGIDVFVDLIAEKYAEQFKPQWIPVTERLPEDKPFESYRLLVYGRWDDESIAVYQEKKFYDPRELDDDGDPIDITNLTTHWMPLPETP